MGLYRALAEGPSTAHELAQRTETDTRYVTEWLRGQAAGGDVMYDPAIDTYWLTEEQAFALTDPDGPLLRRCIAIVPECADAATALALG